MSPQWMPSSRCLYRLSTNYSIIWNPINVTERNIDLPKCQSGERSITLMTIDALHRRAPEIVVEHAAPRCLANHIPVPHHRRYIVVHEVAVERIEIATDRDEGDRRVDAPSGWLVRLSTIASAPPASLGRRLTETRGTVVPSLHVTRRCLIPRMKQALTFVRIAKPKLRSLSSNREPYVFGRRYLLRGIWSHCPVLQHWSRSESADSRISKTSAQGRFHIIERRRAASPRRLRVASNNKYHLDRELRHISRYLFCR